MIMAVCIRVIALVQIFADSIPTRGIKGDTTNSDSNHLTVLNKSQKLTTVVGPIGALFFANRNEEALKFDIELSPNLLVNWNGDRTTWLLERKIG